MALTALAVAKIVVSIPASYGARCVIKEAIKTIPIAANPVKEACIKIGTFGLAGAAGAIAANHIVNTVDTSISIAKTIVDEINGKSDPNK